MVTVGVKQFKRGLTRRF